MPERGTQIPLCSFRYVPTARAFITVEHALDPPHDNRHRETYWSYGIMASGKTTIILACSVIIGTMVAYLKTMIGIRRLACPMHIGANFWRLSCDRVGVYFALNPNTPQRYCLNPT